MKKWRVLLVCFGLMCILPMTSQAKSDSVTADTRCSVCGMFVAKYPQWLASLTLDSGKVLYFDGVKDLIAYYLSPAEFGGVSGEVIKEIAVTDYYNQKQTDGKTAWFVVGSDVLGPMGHELIPFTSKEAAENFLKDRSKRSCSGDFNSIQEASNDIGESLVLYKKCIMSAISFNLTKTYILVGTF